MPGLTNRCRGLLERDVSEDLLSKAHYTRLPFGCLRAGNLYFEVYQTDFSIFWVVSAALLFEANGGFALLQC